MIEAPFTLITGCALLKPAEYLYKVADLWWFNGNFIVNTTDRWLSGTCRHDKVVELPPVYFDRRGVYIFPADRALLNAVALDYILEGQRKYGGPTI